MKEKLEFNNLVTIEVEGTEIYRTKNAQSLDNRNLLIDLYDGTNPSDTLDLALRVFYIVGAASFQTIDVTSSDVSTTEPTGPNVEAWGYERTLSEYDDQELTRGGALNFRGRVYFPEEAEIIRVDLVDNESGLVLFNSEENGTVPTGRSGLITYRLSI